MSSQNTHPRKGSFRTNQNRKDGDNQQRSNSKRRGSPAPKPSASPRPEGDDVQGHMHDRLLFAYARMVGQTVVVTTADGHKHSGILSKVATEGEVALYLQMVRKVGADNMVIPNMVITGKDFAGLMACNIDLTPAPSEDFLTDTAISRIKDVKERELQPWNAGDDYQEIDLDNHQYDPTQSWDQFEVHEQQTGLKSTYREEVYTTAIDRSHPKYAERAKRAEKFAREIEGSASSNPHVREERGYVDDSGLNEEDKFSSVQRNPSSYVPPARRNFRHLPSDADYDPAIISATLSRQTPVLRKADTMPSDVLTNKPPQAQLQGQVHFPPRLSQVLNASPKDPTQLRQAIPFNRANSNQQIETALVSDFTQFVSLERNRVEAKRETLIQKEKSGRLEELKRFSQNFKLKTPLPMDILPILAKDKIKQDEILQKSKESQSNASSPTQEKTPTVPSPATARSETPTTVKAKEMTPLPVVAAPSQPEQALSEQLRQSHQQAQNNNRRRSQVPPSSPSPLSEGQKPIRPKFNVQATEFRPGGNASPIMAAQTFPHIQQSPRLIHVPPQHSRQQPHHPQQQFIHQAPPSPVLPPPFLKKDRKKLDFTVVFNIFAKYEPNEYAKIDKAFRASPVWGNEKVNQAAFRLYFQQEAHPPAVETPAVTRRPTVPSQVPLAAVAPQNMIPQPGFPHGMPPGAQMIPAHIPQGQFSPHFYSPAMQGQPRSNIPYGYPHIITGTVPYMPAPQPGMMQYRPPGFINGWAGQMGRGMPAESEQ
ncbi:Ataxin-2 [Neolecta irregularis DAH-3]|uniref:Ataxin-2 n=1 Tax=Neolecta irregularis (strain DAH-3) TaxID=1198029 RepID=A0A1U7LIT0_NEOID|nr:Ataxin-2 [Neolecta irregularis DAH-3]|eukprot:OLL22431.1 Ataxin-2 [Neolecta irregularis DAH-3]